MQSLTPRLPFDPCETHLSYAARAAAFHIGRGSTPFLRDLGIAPMALVAGEPQALATLAAATGIDHASLERNTPVRIAKRSYRLRGIEFPAEFFVRPRTAYCPACLHDDDATGGLIGVARRHRWTWSLEVVRTCSVHRLPLVRLDKVEHDDELNELASRAPAPGAALEAQIATLAPRAVSPLQDYVVHRLEGRAGPAWLDAQPLDQIVRAAELLGAVCLFGTKVNLQTLVDDRRDEAGREGFSLLAQGEGAVRARLLALYEDFARGSSRPGPQRVFGRLYTAMGGARSFGKHGDLDRILRGVIFDCFPLEAGTSILGQPLDVRRRHSVASLAEESGLDPRTLRFALVASGLLSTETEAHASFSADAGRHLAASIERKVTVISLPKALGCARPLADDLLRERILKRLAVEAHEARGRTRRAVYEGEIAALLNRIARITPEQAETPENYVTLSKAAEKAKCPAVDIVHLVLGGHLRGVGRLAGVHGLDALRVDPAEVKRSIDTILTGISAPAAFGEIRIPYEAGWKLVDLGVLTPKRIEAREGDHVIHRFDWEHIAKFAGEFISHARVNEETGILASEFTGEMRRHGVRPAFTYSEIGAALFRATDIARVMPRGRSAMQNP